MGLSFIPTGASILTLFSHLNKKVRGELFSKVTWCQR